MQRSVAVALVGVSLAACFSKPPPPAGATTDGGPDPGVWLDGFSHRRLVEIDTGLNATLTNVPIVINIRSDVALAAGASGDGSDIVATLDNATLLPSEVASFTADGDLELWVEIPELVPQMSLFVYYGGPATTTSSPWNPAKFAGVWHLSEPGNTARDSLGAITLAANGNVGHEEGVFGNARSFGNGSSLAGGNPPELDFGMSSFSYSLWVNQAANNDPYDIVLYKGCAQQAEPGFCYLVGTEPWSPKLMDAGGDFSDPEVAPGPIHDTWVHLAAVLDRPTEVRGYLDGVRGSRDTTIGNLGSMSSSEPFLISRPDIFFTGLVDEVRIYNGVLEDEWIQLEYAMGTRSGFSTVGPQESFP